MPLVPDLKLINPFKKMGANMESRPTIPFSAQEDRKQVPVIENNPNIWSRYEKKNREREGGKKENLKTWDSDKSLFQNRWTIISFLEIEFITFYLNCLGRFFSLQRGVLRSEIIFLTIRAFFVQNFNLKQYNMLSKTKTSTKDSRVYIKRQEMGSF